jgi:hypothetical protein
MIDVMYWPQNYRGYPYPLEKGTGLAVDYYWFAEGSQIQRAHQAPPPERGGALLIEGMHGLVSHRSKPVFLQVPLLPLANEAACATSPPRFQRLSSSELAWRDQTPLARLMRARVTHAVDDPFQNPLQPCSLGLAPKFPATPPFRVFTTPTIGAVTGPCLSGR